MHTTIFYFSGTGNSLMVAQDLANKLGNTNIVSIASAIKGEIQIPKETEKIGIVYPVYIWGIPKIVSDFIDKINISNKNKYFFAVATNGGRLAGSLLQLLKKLSSRGFKLSLGFSLVMPSNYTPKHSADSDEKLKVLFTTAEKRIDEITLFIKNNKVRPVDKGPLKDLIIQTGIINKVASPFMRKMDKSFWINNSCTSCGLCKKLCPVQNINLKDGKPTFLNSCEQCFRCLNYCPSSAIEFGKNTVGKKRYKNPLIKINDLVK